MQEVAIDHFRLVGYNKDAMFEIVQYTRGNGKVKYVVYYRVPNVTVAYAFSIDCEKLGHAERFVEILKEELLKSKIDSKSIKTIKGVD